ncbi:MULTISPECIES: acetolactate synthase 2 small subunit [unclassified Pseudoalteromonas]|uniref:acetolactate synthase 2 small subunit n=1 Tax=unclassified Pseudoalteromonas TaxID=194690 RepID=UPI000B3D48E5|nr:MULTISPECIES: acetolactate synthase 2 small subunit [unclassified Pseudoalteromonas]MDN3379380.1 acetolactate synthase 2 small subunit [Pseudoalteromonas sp. APC 3893]MDN3386554.1 acetolactate synthase 2 small subunit [Pseudoalteromonas sp. APC 4017]OUS71460.1 acetolactate synthase 2 small subunit [Pseudoalteromonas sp. A601]
MKHSLTVTLKNQSVAVERFLRVVRHRGFDLTHLQINLDDGHYQVEMTVDSDKPVYLLTTQLAKLVDVKQVMLQSVQQQQAM